MMAKPKDFKQRVDTTSAKDHTPPSTSDTVVAIIAGIMLLLGVLILIKKLRGGTRKVDQRLRVRIVKTEKKQATPSRGN